MGGAEARKWRGTGEEKRQGGRARLQQRRELLEVLDARARVHHAALVRELAVRADERVAGDGLAEDLDAEHLRAREEGA